VITFIKIAHKSIPYPFIKISFNGGIPVKLYMDTQKKEKETN